MSDGRSKLTCDVLGLCAAIGKITQAALVVLPSEIIRHHGRKKNNGNQNNRQTEKDLSLTGTQC